MSDYDISGMTDEEKEMPKYTYGSRIPYGWVDDLITKLHQYQQAFENIRAEIENIQINGQIDKHTEFIRTGAQVKNMALEIIDKHDPSLISPEEAGEILKWIGEDDNSDKKDAEIWICPVCGFKMFKVVGGIPNCPKCGRKMEVER